MMTSMSALSGASLAAVALSFVVLGTVAAEDQAQQAPLAKRGMDDFSYAGKRLTDWIAQLESPHSSERLSAARALAQIGPKAMAAVPALTRALREKDEFMRSGAAYALGEIGPEAAPSLPDLITALKGSSYFHGGIIAPAIARIGPTAIPHLTAVLKENQDLRWEVINALTRASPDAKVAIPSLADILSDREAKVREAAAFALWKIAQRRDAIPIIVSCLAADDDFARTNAAHHIREMGPEAAEAVPALVRGLKDESDAVRSRSAGALARIGPAAKDAVPDLMAAVALSRGIRSSAATAAAAVGPAALPALIKALDDPNAEVRGAAADALAMIGPPAAEAAPALTHLMAVPDAGDRLSAAMALWKIKQEPSSVHALVEVLQGGDRVSQFRAMTSLELIGPLAKDAVPALSGIFTGEHGYVRIRAVEVLGRIGPAADPCATALTAALEEDDGLLRVASALALWRICRSERGLATLTHELKSTNDSTRHAAETALGNIGPDAEPAVPALIEALKFDSRNRPTVALTLRAIGPRAKAAVPALIEAFEDDAFLVRESVATALEAIDSEAAAAANITMRK